MKNKVNIWLRVTLLLVSSIAIVTGAVLSPSLHLIAIEFQSVPGSELLTKLVLTSPSLVIALFAPMSGFIVDRFGRKGLLIGSLLIYALAGGGAFFLKDLFHLLLSRIVLGIGAAGVMTAVYTLIADYFEGEVRNRFLGIQSAVMALVGIIMIMLGGVLADIGWQYPFLIFVIPLFYLPLVIKLIANPSDKQILETALDKERIPYAKVLLIYLIAFGGMVTFFYLPTQLPFLLSRIGEEDTRLIAWALSMSTITGALTSLVYHKVKQYTGFNWINVMVFLLMGLGYIWIAYADSYWEVVAGIGVNGLGIGLFIPNNNLWMMNTAPLRHRGRLIGGYNTFFFLGQFISPLLAYPIKQYWSLSAVFLSSGCFMVLFTFFFLGRHYIFKWKE